MATDPIHPACFRKSLRPVDFISVSPSHFQQ
jgi:hypothetical protein